VNVITYIALRRELQYAV